MYMKERDNIKEMVVKVFGRICLVVGNWKVRDINDDYICVVVYFIDDYWKLVRRILCFKVLVFLYDGIYIVDELVCLLF